ncbi:citrate lyase acyl carrier protein [Aggregatibacter actinomycetemcomitans]|uniref:Citrate lyase acyl carrier protein n=1 Tax=Aggregatibacter actinomycetemcomitans serotype e str. SC1083 TaxID=907488 RepID=G4A5Z5_AGGAC|nr:citrate lyase acyl carrier protein [Aggregatibacter actinomycetemcomitans]EGY35128.1 citrate lyase acyl carrier protein [Aggregatibacter actinomycetemcomitans serotype e str. SC1083]KYK73146.1 citrate lyase subunit gamma [Aggregatibacter actinomycetemcomitans serotype e str. SA3096]KYK81732.1 citrate lyase subunit gamma [Aggregatibacter actinomycetemcomitans serotype e str. SC936]KYK95684.1 citrate lyase subunit gamma [Aggregatibacter actinomycetemcomitans serotype e str. ANH9776]MBN6065499
MKITKAAVAGTLESSDVQVRIQPFDSLDIEINSSVAKQFGEQINATVRAVLDKLNVTAAQVIIEDKGALDCVLQARVKAAVLRATEENINWEAVL